MTHFNNLIKMTNVMRHNSRTAVNPDGLPTVNRQSKLTSYLGWCKKLTMILAVLVLSIGNAWGANGDVMFTQDFGSATAVAYSANTALSYSTSSTLSGLVGTGDNLFQGAQCNAKTNCGIAINTTSGANSYTTAGTFQAYANKTSFKWALYKTTNFATTAPTAIKFEMDYIGKYVASTKQEIAVVVGSGFSVGTSAPAANKGYTGFNIISGSSASGKHFIGKVGGTNKLESTGYISNGTSAHITWIINATGSDLTYTGPDSKSYTLATAKYDLWVGTTRVLTAQDRTKTGSSDYSGTTMQNLYIGNEVSGKHEVIIDNVKVTDLTPSCDAADLTASNITSNGDQEAGTGITFSKVGTPASGDTWYWQTSATGTDKTYNATSPYTTATTAGSYTVYLRAFNTDCWGTAASMTNTIYPAPSAMIHNTFAVNDAWGSTIATQDKINITGLNAMAAVGETVGSGSNKSGLTQKIPSQSSEDASKYMSLSFNVASGKQLNVTSVVFDEQPVESTGTFKVSISDNQGSATKTQTIASDAAGTKHTLTLDGDIVGSFKGTVTVKVWAYGWDKGYRFGDYFYINGTVTDATACSAPSSVGISGEWRYFPGQTISLTATPTGHTGTPTYQWQKEISADNWQNISNGTEAGVTISGATTNNLQITPCGTGNTGKYRCSVSTGATCSTSSNPFSVKIFTLNGAYDDGEFTSNNITFTSGTTGTATVHLAAGRVYKFKVTDNFGMWFGNSGRILEPAVNWAFPSNNSTNCVLFTGPEGDYTFTVDIDHVTYGTPEVVVSVAYPDVTHPSAGYAYFKNVDNWTNVALHMWYQDGGEYSAWASDPWVTRTTTICGNTYYYTPLIPSWYNRAIFHNADGSGQTGDITITNLATYSGKYNDKSDANWHEFTTYTISFNAGGGTGTMDAIAGICPNSNQEITANAFEKTGHTFNCWHADKAVKVGGSAVAIGGDIAGGATLQEINNNITLTAQWTPIPVSSISVAPSSKTLEVGGTQQLTATVSPDNAFDRTVTWSTSNGSVATVSSTGLVTAVAAGTCTITATANDGSGKTGTCSITVEAAAAACYTFTPATSGSAPSKGDVINGTGSGGTMVAGTGQSYTANGLKFEPSGDYRYVTVTLDNNLKEGSVIAVTMWMDGTSSNRGLYLQTSAGTQKAEWKFTADSENHQFSYTVEAGDGLINTNVFRLARINNVYLKSVTVSNCGDAVCTTPTTAFGNGAYTVGGSALDLSTLISGKQGSGAITYTVKNANGTGATIAGTSFTATSAGTATVTATQAADATYCEKVMDATITVSAGGGCTQQSVVKTVLSSTTAGTTTGYNNDEYAGDPTIVTFEDNPVNGGYKLKSKSKLFVTLKKGSFVAGDKINIVITKASDVNASTTGKLLIFYNASSPALLSTIDAASAGTYTYTLTISDITTLGSNKTIGVFRSSGDTENNPYVKSVEVEGCRDWTVDETAPTFVSSVPANGATDVATSGTIVLTFSEALGSVDESKFTLTGATMGTVTIDGSDAAKVNITYTGAANSATVTLATAAAAVSDVAGNALAAALSNISFTTAAAAPAGDCEELVVVTATSKTAVTATVGSVVSASLSEGNSFSSIDGYTYAVKPGSSGALTLSPKDGSSFAAGDSLIFIVHNGNSGAKDEGFKIGSTSYVHSVAGKKLYYFRQVLTAANIVDGKVQIKRNSSDDRWVAAIIKHCGLLPSCTTPILPTLTAKTVCEGGDAAAAWDATITNSGSLVSGETVAYSWVKKGGSTPVSSVATYQPTDVTEAMAGTYVVTATVSADGKASKSASKEVELAVNATVEISNVTQSPATVYAGNSVTLTATANVSATWQWYTCTNVEGDGEASISGATSAAYAFTAPASAGTYYYKVKATGPCGGVATEVYALTVSAATGGDCFHYVSVIPTGSDIAISSNASIVTPTHATTLEGGTMKVGSSQVTISKNNGLKLESSKSVSITLDAALEAGNVVIVKGSTATAGYGVTINGVNFYESGSKTFDVSYTVAAGDGLVGKKALTVTKYSGSSYLQEIKITGCGEACTDPAVTASVSKSNVCAGSGEGVTFTASDAHADASYQWQKQNGSAWEDISEATAATYTITTVVASHAGKYRVVASHECDRISNELTLTVATTPVFGDLGGAREVETGGSLSITNVEATSATSYKWYKSANATYDSGSDEQVGTSKNLMLPVSETAGSTFYLFCVASNACTSTVSGAITVNVIAAVEKDCAVAASNGEKFTTAKTSSVSSGTYNSQTELHMSSNNKYIYYVAATGYHFETATVNCCAGDATALTQAAYSYSTDGGETWTDDDLPGAMTNQYSNHVVNLPADVNAFRVGRVLGDHGVGSNTLYVHEVCFTYVADCNATTIAISNATPSYDLSVGGDFTEPTCTVKQGSTALSPQPALRYSSFNEAVATIDPSTGEVDFTGTAGSVVIMASYDGDEDYCASSATYTITVSCGSESAPKIVAGSGTNLSGCNAEVNLVVKDQNGNDFASGSYQWYRDGEEIDGATSASYTANRTGTYTVSHTGACTQMSTNSAVVTSESFDPSVERLVPFQYYHANKTYTDQMKMRHLFAVTSGGDYEGKRYYMTATRNGAPLDITTSTAFSVRTSIDNRVDSVMIDLNKLNGKFNAGDEIVLTCAAIADCGTISAVTENIEIHVIDNTPTLALICSGTNKSAGTRKTSELTVGGDFLTGYNKADLCQQTGNQSFDANTEWGLYTELKEHYIVTPVNGYAVFNKLNYEPFDILLLTDYPKASKSTEAALILDDMYELCDYRPMLSFKTHMVQPADKLDGRESHWKKKGFTTQPEVPKQSRLRLNIVCYAHPMFEEITEGVANDYDDESQIVYTMLSGPGHESDKGMQGFHLAAAENFVTIGLVHYNATATDNYGGSGNVKWTPGSGDEMLVAAAERQTNLEARFILFSLNCGAQSKLTAQGNTVVLKCLEYLLNDATIEGNVADCELTFDNKAGDHKWSNKANWAPKYSAIPGEYNSTRIAAPATVDLPHAKVMSVRIKEGGSIYIPAGSALDVKSTVRHKDVGSDVRPTDVDEIHIGSGASGNGTLIFNNNTGDTKARVDMYSTAKADMETMSAATSTWQYIGTPHADVAVARSNYYDSWLYQYSGSGWEVIPNGGPLVPFRGYCITHPVSPNVYEMTGTLVATTTQDIAIPAGYTVIANSWVAPIDITTFTDDDMENISDKTIYFFNTGTDAEGTAGTGTAPGTYVAVPKNSASYVGTWQIPSMQGFYISTTSDGTLHLDYDRHVRPTGTRTIIVSNPMYAPRRAAAESDEPNVLKIFARGSRYQDKLVVLEREDFTRGYDSGWDGEAWGGSDLSPMVYVTGEGREDAVSAIPEFEGTVIAFKAGEDNEYTIDFEYNSEEPLYLLDTENNTYTQIMTGNAYYFTTSDKSKHARFILTRKAPQIATGVGNVSGDEVQGTKAKKLLIEDKMFIMVNGVLYDATGKIVK